MRLDNNAHADVETVIAIIAWHGYDRSESVRQVAAWRGCSWHQAEQFVEQVMVEQFIHVQLKRIEMILWFPLAAVSTVGLLWLFASSFAATLILGAGLLLGRVLGIDMVDVLLQHLKRTQHIQAVPMTRAGHRLYNLLAWAAGGMLVVFGLALGYAQGWL